MVHRDRDVHHTHTQKRHTTTVLNPNNERWILWNVFLRRDFQFKWKENRYLDEKQQQPPSPPPQHELIIVLENTLYIHNNNNNNKVSDEKKMPRIIKNGNIIKRIQKSGYTMTNMHSFFYGTHSYTHTQCEPKCYNN